MVVYFCGLEMCFFIKNVSEFFWLDFLWFGILEYEGKLFQD